MGGHDAESSIVAEPVHTTVADDRPDLQMGQVPLDLGPPLVAAYPGPPARLHWRSLSDGALVCFLIAAPSLFAGFILRDQRLRVWIVTVPIAAAGFLLGGAVAGRHRRARRGAATQGVACALLTATVIVIADGIRRAVLGQAFSARTLGLWLGVELGSIIVAVVGALLGRRLYIRSRKKRSALR